MIAGAGRAREAVCSFQRLAGGDSLATTALGRRVNARETLRGIAIRKAVDAAGDVSRKRRRTGRLEEAAGPRGGYQGYLERARCEER